MKVYKRNGQEVDFCLDKIKEAISKANKSTYNIHKEDIKQIFSPSESVLSYEQIMEITDDNYDWSKKSDIALPLCGKEKFIKDVSKYILVDGTFDKAIEATQKFLKPFDTVTVDDISELTEKALMKVNAFDVAKEYILYRENRKKSKKFTDAEESVLSVIDGTNEQLRGDNANKHIDVNSSARDYIAGTLCKSIAEKILPQDVLKAHKKKLIHFHDMDYSPVMHEHNCCVYDIEDMLDNGFVMNDVGIKSPKRFSTASNLAAQSNLIISSLQYGGQTFSWTGLAKYVDSTRKDIAIKYVLSLTEKDLEMSELNSLDEIYGVYKKNSKRKDRVNKSSFIRYVENETKHDIHVGVKTYQYQVLCHQSSQGQTPFVSNILNLREAKDEHEQKDLAFIIEEILKRRMKGVTDKDGLRMAPLFPKLLYYVSEGLNLKPGDPYYYLTELAAKCMTASMQPDIISEKKNREAKKGQIIGPMGCVKGDSRIKIQYNDFIIEDSFENFWNLFSKDFEVKDQFSIKNNCHKMIDLHNVKIFDNKENRFVNCYRIIKNYSKDWLSVTFSSEKEIYDNETKTIIKYLDSKTLNMTTDHKMTLLDGRTVDGDQLKLGDVIFDNYEVSQIKPYKKEDFSYDVTTETEHFMVNGLYSHNCRSFLAGVWIEKDYLADTKFHWQNITDTNVQYEGAPGKNFDYSRGFGIYSSLPKNGSKDSVVVNFRGNSGWIKSWNDNGTVTMIEPKVYGRFNGGVVTCNVPHAALTARKNINEKHGLSVADYDVKYLEEYKDEFYKVLSERLELCHKGLWARWELSIKNIKAKNSPLLWQHGALTRLDENSSLEDWISSHEPDYTSFSLGFIGLYETCRAIINDTNTSKKGQKFSLEILQFMNDIMQKWKEQDKLGYSIYATPEENLTGPAADALKRDFGEVPYVTDHGYVTNGYHVNPAEPIDAFTKLKIEGQYLQLCPGGSVSYIEVPDMKNNLKALEDVIQYMYDNIMYSEVNTKIDTCWACGYQGELTMTKTEGGHFVFQCPKCGSTDPDKQRVTRRICGYMGTVNSGNSSVGRLSDIYDRVLHL